MASATPCYNGRILSRCSHVVLARESGKDVGGRDAKHRQSRLGKLDKDALLLFPHDIHLLDSGHVEKSLPEFFGDAS